MIPAMTRPELSAANRALERVAGTRTVCLPLVLMRQS
jgi:hypothetical protein